MEQPEPTEPLTPEEITELQAAVRRSRKTMLVVIPLTLALGFWAVFSWFDHASSLERQYDAQMKNFDREAMELLRVAAFAVGNVVKREMSYGSIQGIERYFRQMKTLPGIVQLTLVRNDGKILASTDMRHQGMEFNLTFREGLSNSRDVSIDREEKGIFRVLIPIVEHDLTKGVVIMLYQNARARQ